MSITSVKSGLTSMSLALDNNFMEPIATTLVGAGGSSTITFSSIPSTYKHLQIRWIGRGGAPNVNQSFGLRFNSDNGTNYTYHVLYGTGASVFSVGQTDNNYAFFNSGAGANATSNVFGIGIVDILDYANTNKNKTVRSLGGVDNNGSGIIAFDSGLWISTSAITKIDVYSVTGNFSQYSRISLYGIKG